MNFTEILCIVTIASICANAVIHWWFGRWFTHERKSWLASNDALIEELRNRAKAKE